jgi:ketosteroid isomerase-like protein
MMLTPAVAPGIPIANTGAHDETSIRELIARWAAAIRARDADRVVTHTSPDTAIFDGDEVLTRGIAAYRKSWDFFLASNADAVALDVDELSVTAGADVAFCHALIYCANAAPDGLNWKLAVRVTIGLRKIDGRSIVVHEHHSVPTRFSSDRATVCHS